MTKHAPQPGPAEAKPVTVTVIGLGAMGQAIAGAFLAGGHPTTVWNRTASKADALVSKGAALASTPAEAVETGELVVVCVLDREAAQEVLKPVTDQLAQRSLLMLTSLSPAEADETSAWAAQENIAFLGGAIMATPDLIGNPEEASLLYAGSSTVFEAHKAALELLGTSTYLGDVAARASLLETGLLASMYSMFAGFFHGAALVGTQGVTAEEFTALAVPWLKAMTTFLPGQAEFIDKGDYTTDVQSLAFNQGGLDHIMRISEHQGIGIDVMKPIAELIDRQVEAGHGADSLARLIEGIQNPKA
ncbi:NAD(P)-dependent oxidoreductase [Streptomyces virginiae]|uniref:NAD(P)-dependent oxidoreductase n=1 Tax=Streptomyces virginiae TaxID=1961 RepID=UPI002DBB7CD7|nr:NAD(P)-binding domain-containing protein [Streptomyces sp. CMAA1738]MEC4576273.1 NAD(P)-binding domain-containing protein [Streptomyces sp. CMAA1738]